MSGGARFENGRDTKTWQLGSRTRNSDEGAMELTTRCTDQANESATTSGSRLGGVMELPRNSDHPRGVLGIPELGTPDCWIEDMIEEGWPRQPP